ncbi:MAG: hypothetical protein COA52_00850 [Hyphomicrobiales bacterium]|nr:MAG: hypothetical protein COA52_00850 [Hyphomicrobiales bacterium]
MALLFSKVLEKAAKKNNPRYGSDQLKDFLRDKATSVLSRNRNPKRFMNSKKSKANVVTQIKPGTMICYFYDAKHKATLPYWDRFPMVFPIQMYKDGFLGINLHYLPPMFRARLMDNLYDVLSDRKYNEKTKLALSYDILNSAAKFKYFKPCIKRYLTSQIQSQVIQIDVREWDFALFLPLARWSGANQRKVWDDSINIINKSS